MHTAVGANQQQFACAIKSESDDVANVGYRPLGVPAYRAHYGTGGLAGGMDNNAIYALNTFSFLQSNGGAVPEPAGILLASTALVLIGARRRKA